MKRMYQRLRMDTVQTDGNIVASTEGFLEKHRVANAAEAPGSHNSNSVAEQISYIHVMRGEDQGAVFPVMQ